MMLAYARKSVGHTCGVATALVNYLRCTVRSSPDYEVKLLSLMLLLNHFTEFSSIRQSNIQCAILRVYSCVCARVWECLNSLGLMC